ncbi:1,4-dihydroxy-2-naphthoate octaprenyltransferase [Thiocapsa imhoffii]|uniref:1,4-dihydroxy-2-naphthoate octaprenyltransferase n=2 Tax=Thiocapsa imhoffii TaxID=382777 RepID=A0A9X1BB17_9GAMM|nr:1,4-dihydroxy-2-naphthoate octaprenyltransferase [Thiocapsa imhoffii]
MHSSRNAHLISPVSHGDPSMTERASNAARWIAAARPKTLFLAASPVIAGIGMAMIETQGVAIVTAILTLLAALSLQIGTNLYNDAVDFERGTDTAERLGPQRATAQGWFSPAQVKGAAHLMFGITFAMGIALVLRGGWPILAVGLASLFAGYAYTGGRRPIAYGPLGEAYVLVFFGVIAVWGSYYLQTLSFRWSPIMAGIALGLPAAAVLLLNNYRDLETDRAAGRRTLCHYLGRPNARWLYLFMLVAPIPILMSLPALSLPWLLLIPIPAAVVLGRRLFRGTQGVALNALLAQTALYQLVLTVLFLLGLALSQIV